MRLDPRKYPGIKEGERWLMNVSVDPIVFLPPDCPGIRWGDTAYGSDGLEIEDMAPVFVCNEELFRQHYEDFRRICDSIKR